MQPPKRFVYILRSEVNPSRYYSGLTYILTRLAIHD